MIYWLFLSPYGNISREKKNHDCFIFCFPLLLTTTDCPLSRGSIGYTHPLSITHSPPPHSYFFVERVMVITRELLSLSCVGPSIHFESHFHCARKEVPSKIKWNKLSVFSLFSPLAPSYVASAAASRSNSTKRISDVIAGCIWLCFVSR